MSGDSVLYEERVYQRRVSLPIKPQISRNISKELPNNRVSPEELEYAEAKDKPLESLEIEAKVLEKSSDNIVSRNLPMII
jgi:hypothetical protein